VRAGEGAIEVGVTYLIYGNVATPYPPSGVVCPVRYA
jgi:hypothetical protein